MTDSKLTVASKRKKKLSNEKLPHFQWELRSFQSWAEKLLNDYQMSGPRNKNILNARLAAVDCILANMKNGRELIIPNFARISADEVDFSRSVFLSVLCHLQQTALIGREGEGSARSIITYSTRIWRYRPTRYVFRPLSAVTVHLKKEGKILANVDTEERRQLNKRLKAVHSFYLEHEILPGIDKQTFNLFNEVEVEINRKPPLIEPDPIKILPVMVYNNRDLTKGGRMYGAFWINMKKKLRRAITIDGELTSDIDGKGMHVQLLYQLVDAKMPKGDPYLFTDDRRSVAKGLMLLMMNTANELPPEKGRSTVVRTYRNHFSKEHERDELIDFVVELEAHHNAIVDLLYKPNWGRLQKTEAVIILKIIEAGMMDGIVILPVHDGCICQRQHRNRVLELFEEQGIEAAENKDHLKHLPVEEAQRILKGIRRYKFA